jgi:hypothetical protein
MYRLITALCVLALVGACGGSRYSSSNAAGNTSSGARTSYQSTTVRFASGPIATACQSAGRNQASRSLCGCVQAVANRSLSRSEQARGAAFFRDPQKAQDTRQSNNPASERFWRKWKAYGDDAALVCE